jgi:Fe-Mn family superoxide dismutase
MTHDNPSTTAEVDRRTLLTGAAAGIAAGLLVGQPAQGQQDAQRVTVRAEAFARNHQPKPLPFDSAKLNGLSQRLIDSHWSNNYGGSVRALNETKKRLADALADRELPAYIYNGMKREHLMRTGSVVLHELYFDNLGGNGRADSAAQSWLASAFGAFDRWEAEFRRIATGLGGGSGWVILGYNRQFGTAENYWMADHMPRRQRRRRCSSWTCTSTRIKWTLARPRRCTSTHSSTTSGEKVLERISRYAVRTVATEGGV